MFWGRPCSFFSLFRCERNGCTVLNFEKKYLRLQYQFSLVVQTNCKRFHSFLGPFARLGSLRPQGLSRLPPAGENGTQRHTSGREGPE